jgi:DNA-binding protein HU-beta
MGDTKKAMTKSQILAHFAEKSGMAKKDVGQFFDDLMALAVEEVKTADSFTLPGFGKIVKSDRKAREGRNPATGEKIMIPAKTAVKMRLSKGFKDSII